MRRLLVLIAFVVLFSGCSLLRAFRPVEPVPAEPTEAAATAEPFTGVVKVSGVGDGRSEPFALSAGNYEAVYGATPDSPVTCANVLTLVSDAPPFSKEISTGHLNGATFVGDVPVGSGYTIDATSTCEWEVTLTLLS
jgi:hypothetical protein